MSRCAFHVALRLNDLQLCTFRGTQSSFVSYEIFGVEPVSKSGVPRVLALPLIFSQLREQIPELVANCQSGLDETLPKVRSATPDANTAWADCRCLPFYCQRRSQVIYADAATTTICTPQQLLKSTNAATLAARLAECSDHDTKMLEESAQIQKARAALPTYHSGAAPSETLPVVSSAFLQLGCCSLPPSAREGSAHASRIGEGEIFSEMFGPGLLATFIVCVSTDRAGEEGGAGAKNSGASRRNRGAHRHKATRRALRGARLSSPCSGMPDAGLCFVCRRC